MSKLKLLLDVVKDLRSLGSIPQLIDARVKLLVFLIQNLPTIITTIVGAIPQIISSLVTAIIGSIPQLVQAGVELSISLIKNLPTIIVEIVKAVPQIIVGPVSAFRQGVFQLANVGKKLVQGLWNGIQSPSIEMVWIGEMLVKGLSSSIEDNGDEVVNVAKGMADNINSVMQGLADDMQTLPPTDLSISGNATATVTGNTNSGMAGYTNYITAVMITALSTSSLGATRDEFQEEMMVVSYLVQSCINENAHVALDQAEYQKLYESLTARFDSVKERLEAVIAEISDKQARQTTIESFLAALQAQETLVELMDKFRSSLWYGLLDFVMVYAKDDVRFTFKNGTENKA